jgi:hypothetical protein
MSIEKNSKYINIPFAKMGVFVTAHLVELPSMVIGVSEFSVDTNCFFDRIILFAASFHQEVIASYASI